MNPGERPPALGEGVDRQARSWSAVLLAFSALGAWLVLGGVGLGVGSWRRLGPGAFPALIGALLIFATAALAWSRPAPASADEAAAASEREGVCLRGVWAALAGLAGFALLAPALGYASAAFAAALLTSLGDPRWGWRDKLLQAAGLAALVAVVFGVGLELPAASFKIPFAWAPSWMP